MKKTLAFVLTLIMLAFALAGCAGTTVVVGNCTCPTGSHDTIVEAPQAPATQAPVVETAAGGGTLKTGLAIVTSLSDSASADAENEGKVKYDVTIAAVTLDEDGVIRDCIVDSVPAAVAFDASGAITSDLAAEIRTKNEMGEDYGMKAYAGSQYEWNEQVSAVAAYAVGKTVEELKSGAVNEAGKAADADLASTATIYIGGYVSAIEAAAANARDLGAAVGDKLKLASISSVGKSIGVTGGEPGTAQLDCNVTALTMNGGVITSCYIDSLQAKVNFDAKGVITTDLTAPVQTKTQLGEAYGMKAWGGAQYEWNEQAASFAAYITGKTPAEVAGIAVTETTAPADADLASSVTISIGGFQTLIAKAAQ
ncbi:MAG: hypothetical protein ACI3V5_08075 [Faecousia sp.]